MVEDILTVFKALSDETRIRILKLLEGGELCVCEIVAALKTSQPKASFHLGVLRDAGLIKDRKEGRWTHYRIDDSDMFRRFLLLSVLEKAAGDAVERDRANLEAFMGSERRGDGGRRKAACRA